VIVIPWLTGYNAHFYKKVDVMVETELIDYVTVILKRVIQSWKFSYPRNNAKLK